MIQITSLIVATYYCIIIWAALKITVVVAMENSTITNPTNPLQTLHQAAESKSYVRLATAPPQELDQCRQDDDDDDNDDNDNNDGDEDKGQLAAHTTHTTHTTRTTHIAQLVIQPSLRDKRSDHSDHSDPNPNVFDFALPPFLSTDDENPHKRYFRMLGSGGRIDFKGAPRNPSGGLEAKLVNGTRTSENSGISGNSGNSENSENSENTNIAPGAVTLYSEKNELYLSINQEGMFVTSKTAVPLIITEVLSRESVEDIGSNLPEVDPLALSAEDVEHFKREGYVILRKAVPEEFVAEARTILNHQMGVYYKAATSANRTEPLQEFSLPEHLRSKIFNNSPILWSAINLLLGQGKVNPVRGGDRHQIAMRFPKSPHLNKTFRRPKGREWHIDGRQCPTPFLILAGVALSDQSKEGMGNLYVWPGQHLNPDVLKYCREYIVGCKDPSETKNDERQPDLGESVPVLLEKGDVVLAHHLLPHSASDNLSDAIRYHTFYRVKRADQQSIRGTWFDDPLEVFAV